MFQWTVVTTPSRTSSGSIGEVFLRFLILGLTSFGGPVAHLGYFRTAFVERHRWLSDRDYADTVALCQFLPGPASSQVGMVLGLRRAGYGGMLAAWVAFTLPSALLLTVAAIGFAALDPSPDAGWLLGLKAAAVGIVAHAVFSMAKSLAATRFTATIAVLSCAAVLLLGGVLGQLGAIAAAAVIGLIAAVIADRRPAATADATEHGADDRSAAEAAPAVEAAPISRTVAASAALLFVLLLVALPALAGRLGGWWSVIDGYIRAGALVFGGGHVVLPLLHTSTVGPGLVDEAQFLAGYGAAQAVPGPLFTFASYLGAASTPPYGGLLGAIIALLAIFLPSMLLVLAAVPIWDRLRHHRLIRGALTAVNAAVVGILAAALYEPVFTVGVTGAATLLVAIATFVGVQVWKLPAWAVVLIAAVLGAMLL